MWTSGEKYEGAYLGTEINEVWWKRYKKDKMFARGNGKFWFDEMGIYFHRYLTRQPLYIPFNQMRAFKIGQWHAGRWAMHIPILKIIWYKDNQKLSSGFALTKKRRELVKLLGLFQQRTSAVFENA
ncbi:MAG: hypothetical protein GWO41_02780 [candidate division Zixibacteria bacterium]|nr:hypothetical protein [candidate division Zixibacteria bacterium]NIR63607.1 hypothetical protein [candidate division Zixibacteria bacterium]NIS15190.1 hypothetical protein [candidate division Zixibacteria bacterium]NIS45575.1 hypothetical protein [candidate division Zixibacteria bacterium]NIT51688.1 hypothetical protein [candidate division Zixibacteria bacterium]